MRILGRKVRQGILIEGGLVVRILSAEKTKSYTGIEIVALKKPGIVREDIAGVKRP